MSVALRGALPGGRGLTKFWKRLEPGVAPGGYITTCHLAGRPGYCSGGRRGPHAPISTANVLAPSAVSSTLTVENWRLTESVVGFVLLPKLDVAGSSPSRPLLASDILASICERGLSLGSQRLRVLVPPIMWRSLVAVRMWSLRREPSGLHVEIPLADCDVIRQRSTHQLTFVPVCQRGLFGLTPDSFS